MLTCSALKSPRFIPSTTWSSSTAWSDNLSTALGVVPKHHQSLVLSWHRKKKTNKKQKPTKSSCRELKNSITGRAFALNVVDLSSISDSLYGPLRFYQE